MLMLGFVAAVIPVRVGAVDGSFTSACKLDPNSVLCTSPKKDVPSFIKTLVNGLLYILGAVAIIVIIFAGIFYTTSMGDSKKITQAKDTLLYAVVGLTVAVISYSIVNFVLKIF